MDTLKVVQGAKLAGASRTIAIDLTPAKLELAKLFGATDCIRGGETAVAELLALTGGGVDYAFEVIGLPATMRQAQADFESVDFSENPAARFQQGLR